MKTKASSSSSRWLLLWSSMFVSTFWLAASGSSGSPSWPGVSNQVSSFCSSRPSLPIDVASMVVHVKRNESFNYKLYLFSREQVFQTGQIIPRDDFRLHGFPVKVQPLDEFFKLTPSTGSDDNQDSVTRSPNNVRTPQDLNKLVKRPTQRPNFDYRHFLRPVFEPTGSDQAESSHKDSESTLGDQLPGDWPPQVDPSYKQLNPSQNPNVAIEFDRDDQLGRMSRLPDSIESQLTASPSSLHKSLHSSKHRPPGAEQVVPVGAFSSFHVNQTYLVRKDFGDSEAQLVRLTVDADKFAISQLEEINMQPSNSSDHQAGSGDHQLHADYQFLHHQALSSPDTRILAINQIYEDWISNNFYTLVYVQRRHLTTSGASSKYEKLVFRGASSSLLGAERMDYAIKAAAFVTEKNGLHYYLEFLNGNKFYVCAVDWTERPFKFIDSRKFPIGATKTKLDNEELLLCPPSVCYSERPLDELVLYGGPNEAPQLHLRDWAWPLTRLDALAEGARGRFGWSYSGAKRANDTVKAKPDKYGFAINGHDVDAAFRIGHQLHIVSANHMISIDFAMNGTITRTTKQPIGIHYEQLSSTLIDPITAAFYDSNQNRVYFFKGDRYVGYDQATRKPLDEFVLNKSGIHNNQQQQHQHQHQYQPATVNASIMMANSNSDEESSSHSSRMVTTWPVEKILGKQHHVDAIYHDSNTDLVYIFNAMKFYTLHVSLFRNGSFLHSPTEADAYARKPICINKHFIDGCNFDEAFKNPCQDGDDAEIDTTNNDDDHPSANLISHDETPPRATGEPPKGAVKARTQQDKQLEFEREFGNRQQMRLRNIAIRNRLLDLLADESPLSRQSAKLLLNITSNSSHHLDGASGLRNGSSAGHEVDDGDIDFWNTAVLVNEEPSSSSSWIITGSSGSLKTHELIAIYVLIAMVSISTLVTLSMLYVLLVSRSCSLDAAEDHKPEVSGAARRHTRQQATGQTGAANWLRPPRPSQNSTSDCYDLGTRNPKSIGSLEGVFVSRGRRYDVASAARGDHTSEL